MTLKKCPFCGGEAKTGISCDRFDGADFVLRLAVFCQSCGCNRVAKLNGTNVQFDELISSCEAVVAQWNRRTE